MKAKYFNLFFFIAVFSAQAQQATLSHSIVASNEQQIVRTSAQLPATVRVLALMVEFQTDNDTKTTGTGKFGSVYSQDFGKKILDPLPHDKSYFEKHLLFLQNYVNRVSAGQTAITFKVLDSVVTVPKSMANYSPKKNENNKAVADLAVDAWTIADKKFPSIDFSQYDFFILFHAGIGRDVNLASIQGFTPNPYDIPSLYIGLNAMQNFYGSSFKGIPVRSGSQFISNSAVVPCTESREVPSLFGGNVLLNLTTNGLIASSFGSYAGLPDLFDTNTGNTGIGRFGLMDGQAIFSYGGICPPEPSAWEKQFLGWTSARYADAGRKEYFLTAHRTDQQMTADILRVPITSSEYWLVENRQRDPAGNGQEITLFSDGQIVKMRFPKDTTGFSSSDLSALRGVVIDVEDVDWMLPGGLVVSDSNKQVKVNGGILIWHIDENIINANLSANTVNADKQHRGVDLEQAAGPQDIGWEQTSPFGTTIAEGSPLDFWFKGNISPVYKNSFGKNTFPPTRTNDGYESHITIDNFSEQSPVMSCEIAVGDNTISPLPGFPVKLFENSSSKSFNKVVQTSDIDGDGFDEIFVSTKISLLIQPDLDTIPRKFISTKSIYDSATLFITRQSANGYFLSDPSNPAAYLPVFNSPPMILTDVNGDGKKEIVIQGKNIVIYSSEDKNKDGFADSLLSLNHGISDIVGLNDGFVYFTSPDTLTVYRNSDLSFNHTNSIGKGNNFKLSLFGDQNHVVTSLYHDIGFQIFDVINLTDFSPQLISSNELSIYLQPSEIVVGKLDKNSSYNLGVLLNNKLNALSTSGQLSGFPISQKYSNSIILADVDGNKRNDIVVTTNDQVLVYNYAGALIDHYPVQTNSKYTLAARLSNDQKVSLFNIGQNTITILNDRGKSIDGFPIQTANNPEAVLFPVGKENKTLGIAIIGDDGYLYAYDLKVPVTDRTFVWRSKYHDERNTNCLTEDVSSDIPFSEFFPLPRCYNWPNPVYNASTKIRYYVSKDATIDVKIYDLAGAKVDELHAKAVGGTDNEIDWNVSSIQSGIYLAHVNATAGGESGEKIIKIAVVK